MDERVADEEFEVEGDYDGFWRLERLVGNGGVTRVLCAAKATIVASTYAVDIDF